MHVVADDHTFFAGLVLDLARLRAGQRAFVDPSGGSEDAMTLAIAHKTTTPDERVIADAVREVRPPFSPSAVVFCSRGIASARLLAITKAASS
jgi:hypothetical protein